MPRSKPPRKPAPPAPKQKRPDIAARNRVLASIAEIARNLGLVFVSAPLIEPIINQGAPQLSPAALAAIIMGLVLLAGSLILDARRSDPS